MRISTKWLNEYVSLDGISPEELAFRLTTAGIEIETIEKMAKGSHLVIGQVMKCEAHPDSDHLQVTQVDIGNETLQIVCGAKNCREGIKVIVAKVGAKLPGIEIKATQVRKVESNGMLCSLQELGVADKYLREDQIQGIEILPDDAEVGNENVFEYLGLDDVILDASLTPNRADCMAMFSVAKEVGAILKREVNLPLIQGIENEKETELSLESKTENCPHLLGKIIGSIQVKPSPEWMKNHLQAAGIKSINNVVDISNYVMLETGQPLHFYDGAKMKKKELIVRDGYQGKFLALDGIEYDVMEKDLVIESDNEVIGLAGVMGSEDSKIDETTTSILIESAHFNHVAIRNTSKRLALITEAASRFTKGLDPLAQEKAMNRAVELLVKYADAKEIEKTKSVGSNGYNPIIVHESLTHCNELLGTNYTMDEVVSVLKALDFKPEVEGDIISCQIPSYRKDIVIAQDLDEEIIRLLGFDQLPTTLPVLETTAGSLSREQTLRRRTRQTLTGLGISEIITYTLVKKEYIDDALLPFGEPVALASAMSEDRQYVRNSLINSMVECLSYNQARKAVNTNLFELSNVYQKGIKQERLGILLSENLHQSRLHQQKIVSDFYALKGVIITWLKTWGFKEEQIDVYKNEKDNQHFHPYRSACISVQGRFIGIFGEIHPQWAKEKEVSLCVYGEFILDELLQCTPSPVRFETLNRFPKVSRDLALVAKEDCAVKEIEKIILDAGKPLVQSVEVFDLYQGEHIQKGYKSIALTIIYQAKDRTLVDDEVQEVHQEILKQLEEKLAVTLRDK